MKLTVFTEKQIEKLKAERNVLSPEEREDHKKFNLQIPEHNPKDVAVADKIKRRNKQVKMSTSSGGTTYNDFLHDVFNVANLAGEDDESEFSAEVSKFKVNMYGSPLFAHPRIANKFAGWIESRGAVFTQNGWMARDIIFPDCDFIYDEELSRLPKFSIINGDFDVSGLEHLKNLSGSPEEVGGDFVCCETNLVSFAGGPKIVMGNFIATDNHKLKTLAGLAEMIGGDLDLSHCNLKTTEAYVRSISKIDGEVIF